jgi:hypothetical protein
MSHSRREQTREVQRDFLLFSQFLRYHILGYCFMHPIIRKLILRERFLVLPQVTTPELPKEYIYNSYLI